MVTVKKIIGSLIGIFLNDLIGQMHETFEYVASINDASFYQKTSLMYQTFNTTREDIDQKINQCNEICCAMCMEKAEETVEFFLLLETFRPILWRFTGKIGIRKKNISADSQQETSRFISVPKFILFAQKLKLFALILNSGPAPEPRPSGDIISPETGCEEAEECIICLDRVPSLILPCTHAFCNVCLQQWTFIHSGSAAGSNCPICREGKSSNQDAWTLVSPPDPDEVRGTVMASMRHLIDHCACSTPQAIVEGGAT